MEIIVAYRALIIWTVVIGVIFLIMWRKGVLAKIRTYAQQTREELRKCSWPTLGELKGSTVVVMISILMLGVFTFFVDSILFFFVRALTKTQT